MVGLHLAHSVGRPAPPPQIDRPASIVVFAAKPDASRVLNEWAHDVGQLLALVEESCHMINKEQMLHAIAAE